MILVNTKSEVRAYLNQMARTELSRTGQRHHIGWRDEALWDIRATSREERAVLGRPCPVCPAVDWLCISPTGLPASGPHPQRLGN